MKINKPKSRQPLPDKAIKVFEGIIFDVYQWEQEMFDGTTETFEKIKRSDTVTVFPVLDNGKIILTKQEQPGTKPFVGAAGGRVDKDESVLDAAKRELLEESGYQAGEYILWKSTQPTSKIEWCVYIFIARDLKKVADLALDSGEKIEPMPVSFEEFLQVASQPNFYEQEIYRDVVEAVHDPKKKADLKRLMLGK